MDRKELPKRTIEQGFLVTVNDGRDQSGKAGSILGKFKERGRVLPRNDTKSLKVGCPGKQNPCPFGYLSFSEDFHLKFGLWEHISK